MPKSAPKRKNEAAAAAVAAEALREIEEASAKFKALGDPTRLRIVLFLLAANASSNNEGDALVASEEGEEGEAVSEKPAGSEAITVGAVAFHLAGTHEVSSNISHHLKELRRAGLISMKRRGKNILCRVETVALDGLEELLCRREK